MTKKVLPASHVRLQRLAAEARSYSSKVGELDTAARGPAAREDAADGGLEHDIVATEDRD